MEEDFLMRRRLLKSGLLLALGAGALFSAPAAAVDDPTRRSKALVAYFTRTGNTAVVARQITRAVGAQLFEIEPATAYPEDYEATVKQAQSETERGFEPALRARVPGISAIETVFLGFPIWGMTAPPVIHSFLSSHDLRGKTLVPFITHGGYGRGQSLETIASLAPEARLIDGFAMEADQERRTLEQVANWLKGMKQTAAG